MTDAMTDLPIDTFTLADLAEIVATRAKAGADQSYTAKLMASRPEGPAKKLGEEAVEVVIAAMAGDRQALTYEAADLIYHLLVVLEAGDVRVADVLAELQRRTAQSGLAEKAQRKR
jgi:phosphoribosyl-ATP pyrophosphohydrolase